MYSAIGVDPTKDRASTSGCAISASTACLSPCTTLNTPSGRPASRKFGQARGPRIAFRGEPGNIQHGTIMGKLNGVMPATTPSGWRMLQLSMPPPIWSVYWP